MIDERKMSKQPSPAPTASAGGPCPTLIQISRTPRHWKFTQHHRTTRPPPPREREDLLVFHWSLFYWVRRLYTSTCVFSFSLSLGDGSIWTEILSQRAVKPKTTNQPTSTCIETELQIFKDKFAYFSTETYLMTHH